MKAEMWEKPVEISRREIPNLQYFFF